MDFVVTSALTLIPVYATKTKLAPATARNATNAAPGRKAVELAPLVGVAECEEVDEPAAASSFLALPVESALLLLLPVGNKVVEERALEVPELLEVVLFEVVLFEVEVGLLALGELPAA